MKTFFFAKSSPSISKMVNFAKPSPPMLNIDSHPWCLVSIKTDTKHFDKDFITASKGDESQPPH